MVFHTMFRNRMKVVMFFAMTSDETMSQVVGVPKFYENWSSFFRNFIIKIKFKMFLIIIIVYLLRCFIRKNLLDVKLSY